MPYKKNYRRKTYRKKSTYNNRWNTYSRAGSQLYKDVNMLKNLINVEFKSKDEDYSNTLPVGSELINLCNGLTKGDDIDNRDGRQVRFKSIQFNGRISRNNLATQPYQRVRFVMVIDKQPNQFTVAWTDVFRDLDVDTLRNINYRKRFVVLWDRTYTVTEQIPVKSFKVYKKLDMKTVYDDGDTGGASDISTNAIYLLAFSDSTANNPLLKYDRRIRWIDN